MPRKIMRGVGIEPTRISTADLKPASLTTRTSSLSCFLLFLGLAVFSFYFRVGRQATLRRSNSGLLRLHVVAVEVALEVEVRERLTLADGEELLERGIGLDVVLVLEALLLHVVVHRLRDLRARHERAVGLAKELAQLIRHLRGDLKDARLARGGIHALLHLGAALALARILDLAVHALLKLLHLREHGRDRLTERVEVARHGLEVLIKRRRGESRRGNRRRLNGRRGNHHRRGGGRRSRLLGGLGLGGSRLRGSGRGGSRHRGSDLLSLLCDSLGCGLGGGGGGAHLYTGGGGSIGRHNTQVMLT